jgi:NAD(P)-dependent dehydrogenase (short-subunit alcohol dehydrogenase family)
MMKRMDGKVVLLTGAAGDIGQAASLLFAAEGARLVLVDRDAEALQRAARNLEGDVLQVMADVTQVADLERAVEQACERFGGLDVVLANAGIEGRVGAPIHDTDPDDFDRVMAVNVRGSYLTLRATLPRLLSRGGGSVVVTSSVAGLVGVPGASAYVTSKHALVGLVRAAALEYAAHGVRVNSVHPAPVRSRMMASIEDGLAPGQATAARQAVLATIPAGRYAEPDEVARMMLFLASSDASFCNGATYLVDGGISAQ